MTEIGDVLALWALIVSIVGTTIALCALAVAYLDWRQVGMESPWKFTAVGGGLWLLERVHRKPAEIRRFEYGQKCSGLEFGIMTPAGIPLRVYRRGDTELVSVSPSSSVEMISIVYKEHGIRSRFFRRVPKRSSLYSHGSDDESYERWDTPVYSNP
ncbi:hypothetical protein AR689_14195 [Arthrobacter sp. EpRS71]|nr:hypothetical protein AR689_14195 [Arthrobacter sp. EpRS71]